MSQDSFNGTLTDPRTDSSSITMSPQVCIGLCAPLGTDYAFVSGGSCYCSSTAPSPSDGSTQCTTPCNDGSDLTCGNPSIGGYSVFKRIVTTRSTVPLPERPGPNNFDYGGCYVANDFIATASLVLPDTSGIEACSATALQYGYIYVGLQGTTCYASNTAPSADTEAGIGLCANPCSDNPLQSCGGAIAQTDALVRRQDTTPAAGTDPLITLYVATPAPATAPVTPDTATTGPTGPSGFFVDGCFQGAGPILDASINGTVFNNIGGTVVANTGAVCVSECIAAGFDYAFTQLSTCYCSNTAPTTPAASQTDCNEACPEDVNERCGGQSDTDSTSNGVFVNVYSRALVTPVRPSHSLLLERCKHIALLRSSRCSAKVTPNLVLRVSIMLALSK